MLMRNRKGNTVLCNTPLPQVLCSECSHTNPCLVWGCSLSWWSQSHWKLFPLDQVLKICLYVSSTNWPWISVASCMKVTAREGLSHTITIIHLILILSLAFYFICFPETKFTSLSNVLPYNWTIHDRCITIPILYMTFPVEQKRLLKGLCDFTLLKLKKARYNWGRQLSGSPSTAAPLLQSFENHQNKKQVIQNCVLWPDTWRELNMI